MLDRAVRWPSPAWAVAIVMTAAMVCCQVLAYESWLLVLVVPLLMECWEANRKLDVYLIASLFLLQMVPLQVMLDLGMASYRPWLIAMLAVWLLTRPAFRLPKSPSTTSP